MTESVNQNPSPGSSLRSPAIAITEIAELFATQSDFRSAMEGSCRILGETAAVSRCYVFENFDANRRTCNTVEWVAPGIVPVKDTLQDVSYDDVPFWRSAMESGQTVAADHISELPATVQQLLEPQDIYSILVYPLYRFDVWYGFVGFDMCHNSRSWTAEDHWLLSTAARILSAGLGQRKTQQEVLVASRLSAIGSLAAGVAHEFNNIHAAILGLAELLQEAPELSARSRKDIDRIIRLGLRATNLTGRLLDVSVRERKVVLVDPSLVLDDVLALMNRKFERHNIQVVLENRAENALLLADRSELAQVFLNILSNAVDAVIPQGRGRITIHVSRTDHRFNVVIADNGPGIPEDYLSEAFEPFFTLKGKLGGGDSSNSGLGLSIASRVVHQMGGTIGADNQPASGAILTISLPLPQLQEDSEHPA